MSKDPSFYILYDNYVYDINVAAVTCLMNICHTKIRFTGDRVITRLIVFKLIYQHHYKTLYTVVTMRLSLLFPASSTKTIRSLESSTLAKVILVVMLTEILRVTRFVHFFMV